VVGEHTEHRGRGIGTVNATDSETDDSWFTSLCVAAANLERLFKHPGEEERVLVPCDQIGWAVELLVDRSGVAAGTGRVSLRKEGLWKTNDQNESDDHAHSQFRVLPNGSRLSCGRNARRRKAVERQMKRLASEATQFFPIGKRPAASSAC